MATSISSFNAIFKNFLEELSVTFPEERQLQMYLATFDTFVKFDQRKVMELFVAATDPHADLILAKDPELFARLKFPGEIDFQRMWTMEGVTDGTREAIWNYLHMLFVMSQTVSKLPLELLNTMETIAQSCAEKMQNGTLDFASVVPSLMSGLMQGLGSGLGDGLGSGSAEDDIARICGESSAGLPNLMSMAPMLSRLLGDPSSVGMPDITLDKLMRGDGDGLGDLLSQLGMPQPSSQRPSSQKQLPSSKRPSSSQNPSSSHKDPSRKKPSKK